MHVTPWDLLHPKSLDFSILGKSAPAFVEMLFTVFKKAKLTEVEIRAVRDCAKICGENVFKLTLSRKALGMQLQAPSNSTQFDI